MFCIWQKNCLSYKCGCVICVSYDHHKNNKKHRFLNPLPRAKRQSGGYSIQWKCLFFSFFSFSERARARIQRIELNFSLKFPCQLLHQVGSGKLDTIRIRATQNQNSTILPIQNNPLTISDCCWPLSVDDSHLYSRRYGEETLGNFDRKWPKMSI